MASKPAPKKAPAAQTKGAGASARSIDWERIELDYRAAIKTLRQIADEHGITHVAIAKRAKRDGWTRDLAERIQAKADELVTKAAVTTAVTAETRIAEKAVVEANAQAVAAVRLAHRHDIQRARKVTSLLLDELEQQSDPATVDLLQSLGELLRNPDDSGQDRLNDLYTRGSACVRIVSVMVETYCGTTQE